MYLKYQAKALYRLIGNRVISFDHKSYDYVEDIPHIIHDGRRINVYSVQFIHNGAALCCDLDDKILCEVIIKLVNNDCEISDAEFDRILQIKCLDQLFHDIYYETDESGDIGDYEVDFLGLYPENLEEYEGLSKNEMLADIANTMTNNATASWAFPANTFVNLNLWGTPTTTDLRFLFIRESSRVDGETIIELYSIDDERDDEQYTDNLKDFSVEEIRTIYAIFKKNS